MSMRQYYEIGGRRVTLKSSVHTWFLYKGEFGRELSEDIEGAISLDELRNSETDGAKKAALFGEEYRLWLSLLWAFAAEGTPELDPFEDWIKTVSGADIADVVTVVTELYTSTLKPDRRNRGTVDTDDAEEPGSICTESLVDDLLGLHLTLSDLKDVTVGQAINLLSEHTRNIKRARGEEVANPDERYKALREAVELIESGQVTNYRPEDLERIKEKLRRWEDG